MTSKLATQCACGECQIQVHEPVLARFYCHCSICQAVYKEKYSDVTVQLAGKVSMVKRSEITFRRYKRWLSLNRGVCSNCGDPVIATLFSIFAFIPSRNYIEGGRLPESQARIFCQDPEAKNTNLSVASGYWKSQLLVSFLIIKRLLRFGR